jgi:bloom syndrome protein
MVSSPTAPRKKPAKKHEYGDDKGLEDFMVSDDQDDAFEPMQNRIPRREETPGLGPPITIDERMADLPDTHRVSIIHFVEAAKSLEEKIRNKNGLRRPFFTESHFREMAIDWTVTVEDMMQIPGIDIDRVKKYGSQFVPLIMEYRKNYNRAMNDQDDRVIDKRENVIDLVTDEEEFEIDEEEEAAFLEAEEGSKYFSKSKHGSSSKGGNASGRKFPWTAGSDSTSSRGGSSSHRGKGRGGKRTFSRKSNGSASGQSSSGVSKRKFSGGAKKSRASKTAGSSSAKGSSIMKNFGNCGGGSGGGGMGGGGGGIGMMPT